MTFTFTIPLWALLLLVIPALLFLLGMIIIGVMTVYAICTSKI